MNEFTKETFLLWKYMSEKPLANEDKKYIQTLEEKGLIRILQWKDEAFAETTEAGITAYNKATR